MNECKFEHTLNLNLNSFYFYNIIYLIVVSTTWAYAAYNIGGIPDNFGGPATKVVREYFPETWLLNIEILEYIKKKLKRKFSINFYFNKPKRRFRVD